MVSSRLLLQLSLCLFNSYFFYSVTNLYFIIFSLAIFSQQVLKFANNLFRSLILNYFFFVYMYSVICLNIDRLPYNNIFAVKYTM